MTTNGEWLDYLAQNAPDELAAWFDTERVENRERALDGDTESENADSRERLEADAFAYLQTAYITYPQIIDLLDRQVAITSNAMRGKIDELTAERDKLRSQICKLEDDLVRANDERDNWKANCEDWKKDCERYRSKFDKCIDHADAIHALMDEGMA